MPNTKPHWTRERARDVIEQYFNPVTTKQWMHGHDMDKRHRFDIDDETAQRMALLICGLARQLDEAKSPQFSVSEAQEAELVALAEGLTNNG